MIPTTVLGYDDNHGMHVERMVRVANAAVTIDDIVIVIPAEFPCVSNSGSVGVVPVVAVK